MEVVMVCGVNGGGEMRVAVVYGVSGGSDGGEMEVVVVYGVNGGVEMEVVVGYGMSGGNGDGEMRVVVGYGVIGRNVRSGEMSDGGMVSGVGCDGMSGDERNGVRVEVVMREGAPAEKKIKDQKAGTPLSAGRPSVFVPGTSLPSVKLLLFILAQLQKKDTYGVFSEPVDPEELPGYHDVIKQPMDFSTVRKKLTAGVYTSFEQFESDVFLICSNAMHYNAPETVYFRQARSIQELAKKNFQSLRQEREDAELHPKPQRGRPSLFKKFMQESAGKPTPEQGHPEPDVPHANAGRDHHTCPNKSNDTRKRPCVADKTSNIPETVGRAFPSFHNSETSTFWSEKKYEKNDEGSGAFFGAISLRLGKKPLVSEENRRDTYKLSSRSTGGQDVFVAFTMQQRHLLPVGLHAEHAYAWSLARFAADLGPVAWRVAAPKMARALPSGMKFAPGCVGEKEDLSCQKPATQAESAIMTSTVNPKHRVVEMNDHSKKSLLEGGIRSPQVSSSNLPAPNGNARNLNKDDSDNTSFDSGVQTVTRLPFHHQKNSAVQQSPNGIAGGFSPPHPVKQGQGNPVMLPMRPFTSSKTMATPVTKLSVETVASIQRLDMKRQSDSLQPTPQMQMKPKDSRSLLEGKVLTHCSDKPTSVNTVSTADNDAAQALWRGMQLHRKPDSARPPDLNVGFQSAGSPGTQNPSSLPDLKQPDLALQL